MKEVSYLRLNNFSGTVHKFNMKRELVGVEGYVDGKLEGTLLLDRLDQEGTSSSRTNKIPCEGCTTSGNYMQVTVDHYTDWFQFHTTDGNFNLQYLGSTHEGKSVEYVFVPSTDELVSSNVHEHRSSWRGNGGGNNSNTSGGGASDGPRPQPHDKLLNPGINTESGLPNHVWDRLTPTEKKIWNSLRPEEKKILQANPWMAIAYIANAAEASAYSAFYFPQTGTKDSNNANAFKHAYFNALNAFTFGDNLAKQLGDAHESPPNSTWPKNMDLYNNAVGRKIGNETPLTETFTIQQQAINATRQGQLRRLNSSGTGLIPTTGEDK